MGNKKNLPHGSGQQNLNNFLLTPTRFKRGFDQLPDNVEDSDCAPSPLKVKKTRDKNISTKEKCPPLVIIGQSISKIRDITDPLKIKNLQLKLFKEGIKVTYIQSRLFEPQQIDDHIHKLTKIILEAQDKAIPRKQCSSYKLNLPDELINTIKIKNSIKRAWQRSRDDRFKAQVRLMERIIKERVNIIRNDNWSHKLSTILPNHTNIWKVSKFLTKQNSKIPPLQTVDGLLLTSEQKANKIADVFQTNHINPLNESSPDFSSHIKSKVSDLRQPLPSDRSTTLTDEAEINAIIRNLKNPKCPGPDKISNRLIKNLPRRGIKYLSKIFNSCLYHNYFPTTWKSANVVPIPKPGKKKADPTAYRPISLLSSLSKILERIILIRIQNHIEINNIIPNEQHGFRSNSSTTHLLYKIINHANTGLKSKKSTGLLSLDVEKAFDRIWHEGLIAKMIDFKFPNSLILITKSFLSERTFKVICDGSHSTIRSIPAGVPQGAVLSPTLYNIYTADVPISSYYETALFADDTSFYKTATNFSIISSQLKLASRKIASYMEKWKILINTTKTSAIYVTNGKKKEIPIGPIEVFDTNVEWQDSIKLLGIHIDKRLTFKQHIDSVITKANLAIRMLYPLICRKSKLHVENKLLIYKLAIRPILTYGYPAFHGFIADTHTRKLQTLQNRSLKMILDRPWWESTQQIHADTNLPLINSYLYKITTKFRNKLTQS
ncbi:hypothetical protein PVAND_000017 [Polypedilum vanderplanki]|uniref:Reverse transcriptase domain-containing protein n=1 Tax=Polypedilum vanderplanki TaxID=319348 RepID=A0A9J6BJ29_POLVA|nr:hypothetical protein PVAND_000017 [Polypedilum vanderplanki]